MTFFKDELGQNVWLEPHPSLRAEIDLAKRTRKMMEERHFLIFSCAATRQTSRLCRPQKDAFNKSSSLKTLLHIQQSVKLLSTPFFIAFRHEPIRAFLGTMITWVSRRAPILQVTLATDGEWERNGFTKKPNDPLLCRKNGGCCEKKLIITF